MNAHALAAVHTRQPDDESRAAWIAHTVAVCCAWSALDAAVRRELKEQRYWEFASTWSPARSAD